MNKFTSNIKAQHLQQQQPPITDSFFIDSINENNLTSHTKAHGILDTKDPKFSDSEEVENRLLDPALYNNNHKRQASTRSRMKNWKSESNLIASNQRLLNQSLNNPNDYGEEEEYQDEYDNFDYYIDGVDGEEDVNINEPLQFSDHAALYDPYENEEHLDNNSDSMDESKYLNEHKRRTLLDNYDIYTKKNYKLTYSRRDG